MEPYVEINCGLFFFKDYDTEKKFAILFVDGDMIQRWEYEEMPSKMKRMFDSEFEDMENDKNKE